MTELFHITERGLWETARERGAYEMSRRRPTTSAIPHADGPIPVEAVVRVVPWSDWRA